MPTKAEGKKRRFSVKEWSWIMYDWANSVYATNIMAAIFPTIFVNIAGGAGSAGDIWWGRGISLATLIVAVLAPLLGAVADYKGMKKKLFTVFMLLGVVSTFFIALVMNSWKLMLVGYILSRIGFSASCLFYDSFLTDVTTDERMDKVSSWGYAMGYIGGSTIPFVISIAVLLVLGYESPVAQKFSIIITSVWWLAFSLPFLKNVEQTHYIERTADHTIRNTFRNIGRTARDIFQRKGLFLFVLAYFFYIDGVGTIINISTAYGTVLGLGSVGMILALLVTQIVAMPCSIWFANIAQKITARKALIGAIIIYTLICVVGFYMGFSLEPHQQAYEDAYQKKLLGALEAPADFAGDPALSDGLMKAIREDQLADFKLALLEEDGAYAAIQQDAREALAAQAQQYADLLSAINTAVQKGDIDKAEETAIQQLTAQEDGKEGKYALLSQEAVAQAFAAARTFAENEAGTVSSFRSAVGRSTLLFWAMAALVGTVQGGIQAVSRSYFGKLIPKERSNEFYGFFDIFGKFASVMGPFLYATIRAWTGRPSYGVLALIVLFLIGLVIMVKGRKELDALEAKADA